MTDHTRSPSVGGETVRPGDPLAAACLMARSSGFSRSVTPKVRDGLLMREGFT